MANTCLISFLNPVRFYEETPTQFPQYNTKHYNDYPFHQTILPWQEKRNYMQKWQTSDTIYLQVTSNFDPLQVDVIYRETGASVYTAIASAQIVNARNPGFYVYQFTIPLASIIPGCYYLTLSNSFASFAMFSEPLHIAEKHPNTLYFQYRNSRYLSDVLFETGLTFGFRVEGSFGFVDPGANIQAYEDQRANPRILSARPFVARTLNIGGSFGIPDWAVHLMELIFCCNDVRIDGKSYARDGESEITFETEEDYPLRGVNIPVREGINLGSKIAHAASDPNKRLLVVYQIETDLFGPIGGYSYVVPITDVG